jgi:RyR domain
MTNLTEIIAKVCHEANKAYCEGVGDFSQKSWSDADQWQRDSAIAGVRFRLDNPGSTSSDQHQAWLLDKEKDGWVYGPVKNAEEKTHPCMVPYDELPVFQRSKDKLFQGVVDALSQKA